MFKKLLMAGAALALAGGTALADETLDKIGITLGSLGNPFFVTMVEGATAKAKEINPNVEVIEASAG